MSTDNPKYFLFDTETGGLKKDMSLLTLYGYILDENLNVLDFIDLKIKPDDGIYNISAQALEINKIVLTEHDKVAITLTEAKNQFANFVWRWALNNKLTPVGHNVRFDVKFVKTHLLEEWDRYFDRRHLDTASIGKFLSLSGKLSKLNQYSLTELATAFEISFDTEKRHDAQVDAELTLKLLKNMIVQIKGKNI